MPCQILVSNQSGIAKAEIVTLVDGDHLFSKTESMQEFLNAGGLFEDWSRLFSIVKYTDKNLDEIQFLNDYNEDTTRKWAFIEPPRDTQEWVSLYLTGEFSGTSNIISQYLVKR